MVFILLAVCGAVAACGGGLSSSAAPSPTPNTAAEVAAVKAAVTAFIQAYAKSEETGDAKPVEKLTVPGSPAVGDAGNFAAIAISTGTGFKTIHVDIKLESWSTTVNGQTATASVRWSAYGYDMAYPSGAQVGSPHQTPQFSDTYSLEQVGRQWLVSSFS